VLVGEGSFHLRLSDCLARRGKWGVAGSCSVMMKMDSYLGSYGPNLAGQEDPYATATYTTSRLHSNLLFIVSLITLNLTETRSPYTYVNLDFVWLITPEIVLYRSDVVSASESAESRMKIPDGE
jgi:hypothetical protein